MTPEPYVVLGGPFDLKVERLNAFRVALRVIGDKGDLITQIEISTDKIPNVIAALLRAREGA